MRGALSLDLVNWLAEGHATFDWLLDEQRFQGVYDGQRRANEALSTLTLQAPWQATVAATTDARQAWNAWEGTLDLPPQSLAGLPAALADIAGQPAPRRRVRRPTARSASREPSARSAANGCSTRPS